MYLPGIQGPFPRASYYPDVWDTFLCHRQSKEGVRTQWYWPPYWEACRCSWVGGSSGKHSNIQLYGTNYSDTPRSNVHWLLLPMALSPLNQLSTLVVSCQIYRKHSINLPAKSPLSMLHLMMMAGDSKPVHSLDPPSKLSKATPASSAKSSGMHVSSQRSKHLLLTLSLKCMTPTRMTRTIMQISPITMTVMIVTAEIITVSAHFKFWWSISC